MGVALRPDLTPKVTCSSVISPLAKKLVLMSRLWVRPSCCRHRPSDRMRGMEVIAPKEVSAQRPGALTRPESGRRDLHIARSVTTDGDASRRGEGGRGGALRSESCKEHSVNRRHIERLFTRPRDIVRDNSSRVRVASL
ncbi:hypothetical protein EYF80_053918 [Liparis tanakae]|uniref:Uncharacterized protein n=1 Tax=Liparis tanakae TaxID=230148 RepID=A0A4Z2F585_9TELE|nr:hypothetical protein EYF80_053918 [Liparis tanakae]